MVTVNPISVVIPTFNNLDYILPCIKSIAANTVECYRFIIVNNGSKELERYIGGDIKIVNTGKNLGWTGGCNEGLKHVDERSDYVLFMNDDTMILPNDYDWLYKLRMILDNDPTIAAVGPSSNVVMGLQHFGLHGAPALLKPKYLIGFCVMMRKSIFEEIGAMDESLPGGDDLDWSIRFRKAGYGLVARRDVFVYHFGFKTGNRVHGDAAVPNGWNSQDMTEKTNIALIRKHGFKWWLETARNEGEPYDTRKEEYGDDNMLLPLAVGRGIDVGCGENKLTPETVGVDLCAQGEKTFQGAVSKADVKASGDNLYMFEDNSLDYVVARHNIEHYTNPLKTLREWNRVLRPGGKLGITTPDDARLAGIRLDGSHKHSFSREGMKDMLELTGFVVDEIGGTANQWNFYAIAHKGGK